MEMQIVTPEVEKSTETALTILDAVKSLTIITVDDYRFGQSAMKQVKDRISELTDTRMAQTRPLDESKAKIIAFFAVPLQKLNDAKNYLNTIMVKFTEEQEVKRREEERLLNEAKRKREEEETLARAIEAEEAGEKEEAEQILKEPSVSAPIKLNSEIPKSKGSHIRTTWSADGFDLLATVKAIADGKAPLQAVKYDLVFLNSQATDYNLALNIPGIRAVSKKTQI